MDFKVLVIDDNYINRKLLIEMLKNKLFKVQIIESANIEDAIYTIESEDNIQFIFIDVGMAKINGLEFLDIYKNAEDADKIPIIAISSNELKKRESLEKGADEFITKPITEKKLMDAIISTIE